MVSVCVKCRQTAHEGEHRHTAIHSQCIQVATEMRLSDHINDQVDALPARRGIRNVHKILFLVIRSMSGTGREGQKPIELVRGRCRGGHGSPEITERI